MSKRGKAAGKSEKAKKTRGEIRDLKSGIRHGVAGNSRSKTRNSNGEDGNRLAARNGLPAGYWKACELARDGRYEDARAGYLRLARGFSKGTDSRLRALVQNDLAVLDAMDGKFEEACEQWRGVVEADQACLPARLNFGLVRAEMSWSPANGNLDVENRNPDAEDGGVVPQTREAGPVRVAVLSLLFNWPSTGGGNMHTAGLVEFLGRDGFAVRHFYAHYEPWGIGRVTRDDLVASEALAFAESEWNVPAIRQRFRAAVDAFGPDYVVISDTWNMKPYLAEAMRGYPTILLMQAQECLCPLNNLRLLGIGPVRAEQCPRNQLATPHVCHQCLAERGQHSGALHQVERALAGVGTPEYDALMRQMFYDAEAVLVLNPITSALLEPFARRVCVVPWGIDPARFASLGVSCQLSVVGGLDEGTNGDGCTARQEPRPPDAAVQSNGTTTLFMAAVAGEVFKGFHVAHEACRILRETRKHFELVVTFDPAGPIDDFTCSVGWCSQDDLPRHYRDADICLVPTIAQDALSITSVEAMAAGRPVIASRIGGLPYTVSDGLTGLLFEPGNAFDLAEKIGRLLDEPQLRNTLGLAGRRRFEEDFTWPDVIKRYWRPLLRERVRL